MTPSQLKYEILKRYPDNQFFSRDSMSVAGDTMRNYGVARALIVTQPGCAPVECWELYRKMRVNHGIGSSAYFSLNTFKRIFKV